MRSDLVHCIHIDMTKWRNRLQFKVSNWGTEWFHKQVLQNIIGFKNWYACEYILFLIVY